MFVLHDVQKCTHATSTQTKYKITFLFYFIFILKESVRKHLFIIYFLLFRPLCVLRWYSAVNKAFLTESFLFLCLPKETLLWNGKKYFANEKEIFYFMIHQFPEIYESEGRSYYFISPKNKFIYFYKGGTIILFKLFYLFIFYYLFIYFLFISL